MSYPRSRFRRLPWRADFAVLGKDSRITCREKLDLVTWIQRLDEEVQKTRNQLASDKEERIGNAEDMLNALISYLRFHTKTHGC